MADADLALVRALQAGEDSALDQLMDRHQEPLFRFIRGYVQNEADATELTQETFVRAYFAVGRFKPTAKFATWLYRIALNLCRDHVKSRRMRNASQTDSLSQQETPAGVARREFAAAVQTPAEATITNETLRGLDNAIAQLPHDLRAAFVLSVLEQRSQGETAELLRTTRKSIETRIYRARKLLLKSMSTGGF